MWSFSVLGPLAVSYAGLPVRLESAKQRVLLAALLADADRLVSADQLVDDLWGEAPPRTAKETLHSHVARLRRLMRKHSGEALPLVTHVTGYAIQTAAVRFDLHEFDAFAAQVKEASAAGDFETAARLGRRALAIWRGPALADVDSPRLQSSLVPHLARRRREMLAHRIDADLACGRHLELVPELEALAAEQLSDERIQGQLMVALARSGRNVDALELYRSVRAHLVNEFGVEPGPDLRRRHQEVLANGDTAGPVRAGTPASAGPVVSSEGMAPSPRGTVRSVLPLPLGRLVPGTMLPRAPGGFCGRDAELAAVRAMLLEPASAPVMVVGMAGIGKTALALHAAHSLTADFPDGQLFVDLHGFDATQPPRSVEDALGQMLSALGLVEGRQPSTVEHRAARLTALLAGTRTLIVLDDAVTSRQVRALLPGEGGCAVLVTSRNQLDGLVVTDGGRTVPLGVLSPAGGHDLLAGVVGRERLDQEPVAAARLVELSGGLPLALRIMAAQLKSGRSPSMSTAATQFELTRSRISQLSVENGDVSLRAVFDTSYDVLPKDAARLLAMLGLHPGYAVTAHAAAAMSNMELHAVRQLFGTLCAAHLCTGTSSGAYELHALVADYARTRAEAELSPSERDATQRRLLDFYLAVALRADRLAYRDRATMPIEVAHRGALPEFANGAEALRWLDDNYSALLGALEYAQAAGLRSHLWQLPYAMQVFFAARGDWAQCVTINERALVALHGGDPRMVAVIATNLGVAYAEQRCYPDALKHLHDAREYYHLAGELEPAARIQTNIGLVHALAGEPDLAISCYEESRAVLRELGAVAGEAKVLINLADTYFACGHDERALSVVQEAIDRLAAQPNPRIEAAALESLGNIHAGAGRIAQAEQAYLAALTAATDAGELSSQARLHDRLGRGCASRDPAMAATHLLAALDFYRRHGDPAADEVSRVLATLDPLSFATSR